VPSSSFGRQAIRGAAEPTLGTIDHRLARRHVVAEYRRGRLAKHEVCDAHPELVRAAEHASRETQETCPICEQAKVVLVSYVFGPRLPAYGRCITTAEELAKLSKRSGTFTCYVVEVCPGCRWNHLAQTFQLS
jgi:hypothetical protein